MTTLESDLKRLVQNAKDYNAPKSDIYEDAERIRKLVYNYMKIHNPAYEQDPDYVSFPTAIPLTNGGSHVDHQMEDTTGAAKDGEPNRRSVVLKNSEPPSERKTSVAPSATTGDEEGGDGSETDFTGKTFQQAQQLLIAEFLKFTDAEGLEVYTPFVNLPSRKLVDYYKVIRHPVCFKSLAKRTRGQHGHGTPSGISDFRSWSALEEEASFIWRNARDYNEDGSEMYTLANDFEVSCFSVTSSSCIPLNLPQQHFKKRLATAKEKVEEPSRPSIKLGGPKPKVTLNLSQHRGSPTPGVSVDNEALARQRHLVQAGANAHSGNVPVNGTTTSAYQASPYDPRPQSRALAGSPAASATNAEGASAPTNTYSTSHMNGMMPPPLVRPASGSPFHSYAPINSYTFTAPAALPSLALRSYPLEQALLPTVTIATHPQLKVSNPLNISIPPHPTLTHQSSTITLAPTHYFLQISPTISKQLSTGRPYKMFVTVNGSRLTQRDTQFSAETGKRTHMYEGTLAQGVNRIEIEIAAAKEGDGNGLDVEKVLLYANLMK